MCSELAEAHGSALPKLRTCISHWYSISYGHQCLKCRGPRAPWVTTKPSRLLDHPWLLLCCCKAGELREGSSELVYPSRNLGKTHLDGT
jgi:hypothetical protein